MGKALIILGNIHYEEIIEEESNVDIYLLYHYVSKPIQIQHNVGPSYPNPLLVYITKVNNDQSIEVICRNALGVMGEAKFTQSQITNYICLT